MRTFSAADDALIVHHRVNLGIAVSIGLAFGLAFGFFFAAAPNLLMDTVPAQRQGISAGMFAVFGSVGTAITTALFTAIVAAHPYQMVITAHPGSSLALRNDHSRYVTAAVRSQRRRQENTGPPRAGQEIIDE